MNQFMLLKNQQAVLAIAAGISIVLLVVVSYLAIWQPRLGRKYWVTQQSRWRDSFNAIPWILVFVYGGIAIMAVVTMTYYASHPPNW